MITTMTSIFTAYARLVDHQNVRGFIQIMGTYFWFS